MARATVPASEYDALAEAFREFVAARERVPPEDVGREQLVGRFFSELADEEVDFIADALRRGSRALSTRSEGDSDDLWTDGDIGGLIEAVDHRLGDVELDEQHPGKRRRYYEIRQKLSDLIAGRQLQRELDGDSR
jgi:hypothetical protein